MTEAINTIPEARAEGTANPSIPRAAHPGWPLPTIAADAWDAPLRGLIAEGLDLCAYKNRCNHEMVIAHLAGTLHRDSARLSRPVLQAARDLESLVNKVARLRSLSGEALLGKALLLHKASRAAMVPEPLYALGWSLAADLNSNLDLRFRLLEAPDRRARRLATRAAATPLADATAGTD